ncbi:MAG: putative membrane protein, partial [uncultured Nocardioidaceae bacterium]
EDLQRPPGRRPPRRHLHGLRRHAPGQARGLPAADAEVAAPSPRGHHLVRGRRAWLRSRSAAPGDPAAGRPGERGAARRRLPRQPQDGGRRQPHPQHEVQGDRLRPAAAAAADDPHRLAGGQL